MSIDFLCPECGAEIEAPESAAGRTANCPECDTQLTIPTKPKAPARRLPPRREERVVSSAPERRSRRGSGDSKRSKRPRPDAAPTRESRRPSRRKRAVDEHDDYYEDDSNKRSRETQGPNFLLLGGIGAVVLVLIIVLIFLMKNDSPTDPGTASPTPSAEANANSTPTPVQTPKTNIDAEAFVSALSTIASSSPMGREKTIAAYAKRLFAGGKASIQMLIDEGIKNPNGQVRITANDFLVSLTNAQSQEELLYSDDPAEIARGTETWVQWWNENKAKSLYDLLAPAQSGSDGSKVQLALALGFIKDKTLVPLLFSLLEDRASDVRRQAINSVVELLHNDSFSYNVNSSADIIAESVKKYRDWWDGVKANYDFAKPDSFLP